MYKQHYYCVYISPMKSQINFNKVNKHNSKYTVKNTIKYIYQVNTVLSTDFFFLQISCFINFKFWAKYDDLL